MRVAVRIAWCGVGLTSWQYGARSYPERHVVMALQTADRTLEAPISNVVGIELPPGGAVGADLMFSPTDARVALSVWWPPVIISPKAA